MNINTMSDTNQIRSKISMGHAVMGMWSIISSPALIEVFATAGLDFIILDMEHGIYDVNALDNCIRACEAAHCAPIVRVPGLHPSAIQWALDLGAHGIIVPQVNGYDQVVQAVRMAKFSPTGTRGYNPFTKAGKYASSDGKLAGKLRNEFGFISVIIETENSLNDLQKICSIPDLDMIYIGVYDLSVSLGYSGDTGHPSLLKIVTDSVRTIRQAGKAAGVMVRDISEISNALEIGANLLVYSVDTRIIYQAMSDAVQAFKHTQ